jgi:FKBP-type peptidyl-prolyl cis-trans isomerase FkpA
MNLKLQVLIFAGAGILAAGCGNADFKKTKDGLAYKIISDGKGAKIKPGQFLKINFSSVLGDSVMFSTFEHIPAYGKYDSSIKNSYDFIDFLGEMSIGDSAVFSRSVDTLQKRNLLQFGGPFKKGGVIKGYLKVLSAFNNEAEMSADHEKELEKEKVREVADLEKYLKEKKITNTGKTPGGVFVVMEKEGTGPLADSGHRVSVNYTGYLKNGKKFDSNTDSSFQHVKPYEFVVGTQAVIPGWDEGIKLFKAGGKGKMYVPAMLAYGPQSQGERMPAFSDLIFDIELLSVAEGPAPAPPMPENIIPQGH